MLTSGLRAKKSRSILRVEYPENAKERKAQRKKSRLRTRKSKKGSDKEQKELGTRNEESRL